MPGLKQMTSTSSGGGSVITLQFNLDEDIDVAEQEVQAAINAAQSFLPTDLPNPPIYSKVNPADAPIMTLALTSETLPLCSRSRTWPTPTWRRRSRRSPASAWCPSAGGQKPAVRIQANPAQLAAYGLSLEDLRTALADANVNTGQGQPERPAAVVHHRRQRPAVSSARATSPSSSPTATARRCALSDVADVIDGVENTMQAAWMNRTPAVIVNIQRQPGANIIAVVDRIKTLLPQLRPACRHRSRSRS